MNSTPLHEAPKAAVVGAGLGGLASACRLARMGFSVDVFESQAGPGGKAGSETWGAYRFDTGPSLLTMPHALDELFEFCGKKREDYISLVRIDPVCHYFYDDGSQVQVPGTAQAFIQLFSQKKWATKKELQKWFAHIEGIYRRAGTIFLNRSLHLFSTWLSKAGIKGIFGLPFLDAFRNLDASARAHFSDPRLVQLINRYATYNGSSPYKTPATLGIIPYVETAFGAWSPQGGIYDISKGLEKLALNLGVRFHYSSPVLRILSTDGRVWAIEGKDGLVWKSDVVISNADVLTTYQMLNDPEAPLAKTFRRGENSSSGLVFYWGMDKSWKDLGLHNIFFSPDYKKEFDQIFNQGIVPTDPTVYVNITSKLTPSDAPEGGENWFVLINVPSHQGQDWQLEAIKIRQTIINRIEKALGSPIESHIAVENILTPEDIEKRTGSSFGSLYGLASNTWDAAFKRHPNRSKRHKSLYLVGGSVHPGGGMPLVIKSAAIACSLLARDGGLPSWTRVLPRD